LVEGTETVVITLMPEPSGPPGPPGAPGSTPGLAPPAHTGTLAGDVTLDGQGNWKRVTAK
jgi:hypothetical protein